MRSRQSWLHHSREAKCERGTGYGYRYTAFYAACCPSLPTYRGGRQVQIADSGHMARISALRSLSEFAGRTARRTEPMIHGPASTARTFHMGGLLSWQTIFGFLEQYLDCLKKHGFPKHIRICLKNTWISENNTYFLCQDSKLPR